MKKLTDEKLQRLMDLGEEVEGLGYRIKSIAHYGNPVTKEQKKTFIEMICPVLRDFPQFSNDVYAIFEEWAEIPPMKKKNAKKKAPVRRSKSR